MQDLTLAAVSVSCEFSGSVGGFSSALLPLFALRRRGRLTGWDWCEFVMATKEKWKLKEISRKNTSNFYFVIPTNGHKMTAFDLTSGTPCVRVISGFWAHCHRLSPGPGLSPLVWLMSAVDKVISARNWSWRSALCHSGKSEWLSCHANGVVRLLGVFHSFEFSYTYRLEHPQKHGRGFCSRTPWFSGLFVVVCSSSGFRWVNACKQPLQMACALHVLLRPNVVPEYTSSHPYFMLALLLTVCTLGWAPSTPRYRRCSVYFWARPLN